MFGLDLKSHDHVMEHHRILPFHHVDGGPMDLNNNNDAVEVKEDVKVEVKVEATSEATEVTAMASSSKEEHASRVSLRKNSIKPYKSISQMCLGAAPFDPRQCGFTHASLEIFNEYVSNVSKASLNKAYIGASPATKGGLDFSCPRRCPPCCQVQSGRCKPPCPKPKCCQPICKCPSPCPKLKCPAPVCKCPLPCPKFECPAPVCQCPLPCPKPKCPVPQCPKPKAQGCSSKSKNICPPCSSLVCGPVCESRMCPGNQRRAKIEKYNSPKEPYTVQRKIPEEVEIEDGIEFGLPSCPYNESDPRVPIYVNNVKFCKPYIIGNKRKSKTMKPKDKQKSLSGTELNEVVKEQWQNPSFSYTRKFEMLTQTRKPEPRVTWFNSMAKKSCVDREYDMCTKIRHDKRRKNDGEDERKEKKRKEVDQPAPSNPGLFSRVVNLFK